jgi:uncharacterized membrane protein (UPF0127 family)
MPPSPASSTKMPSASNNLTPSEVNYVLELNGGESDKNKFKTGDTVTLKGVK